MRQIESDVFANYNDITICSHEAEQWRTQGVESFSRNYFICCNNGTNLKNLQEMNPRLDERVHMTRQYIGATEPVRQFGWI